MSTRSRAVDSAGASVARQRTSAPRRGRRTYPTAAARPAGSAPGRSAMNASSAGDRRRGRSSRSMAAPRPARAPASRRPAQHEAVVQQQTGGRRERSARCPAGRTCHASPRATRPGGERVDQDEPGAVPDLDVEGLAQRGAGGRDRVVGHPLGDRPGSQAQAHRSGQPAHRPSDRRASPRAWSGRRGPLGERHIDHQPIAAEDAAGGIQQRDDGGRVVEGDGRQHLQRQDGARGGEDGGVAAPLEGEPQRSVAPDARREAVTPGSAAARSGASGRSRRRPRRS